MVLLDLLVTRVQWEKQDPLAVTAILDQKERQVVREIPASLETPELKDHQGLQVLLVLWVLQAQLVTPVRQLMDQLDLGNLAFQD